MRNYLAVLGLGRNSDIDELNVAIDSLPTDERDLEDDIRAIFSSETHQTHYERVHLQYEAIAAAEKAIGNALTTDTNQWSRRLVEFSVDEDILHLN